LRQELKGIIYHEMMVAEINKKEDKEHYQILIEQNLYEKNEADINSLTVSQAEMKTDIEYIKKSTTRIEDIISKSYSLEK
jgi:hypothetical protein